MVEFNDRREARECEGSGRHVSFSTGQAIAAGNVAGASRQARVVCPRCKGSVVGRIVSSAQGVKLNTPMARIPKHRRRSL